MSLLALSGSLGCASSRPPPRTSEESRFVCRAYWLNIQQRRAPEGEADRWDLPTPVDELLAELPSLPAAQAAERLRLMADPRQLALQDLNWMPGLLLAYWDKVAAEGDLAARREAREALFALVQLGFGPPPTGRSWTQSAGSPVRVGLPASAGRALFLRLVDRLAEGELPRLVELLASAPRCALADLSGLAPRLAAHAPEDPMLRVVVDGAARDVEACPASAAQPPICLDDSVTAAQFHRWSGAAPQLAICDPGLDPWVRVALRRSYLELAARAEGEDKEALIRAAQSRYLGTPQAILRLLPVLKRQLGGAGVVEEMRRVAARYDSSAASGRVMEERLCKAVGTVHRERREEGAKYARVEARYERVRRRAAEVEAAARAKARARAGR